MGRADKRRRGGKGTSLVGTTLANRYAVDRELGHGAMGSVYEAHHTSIGRRLAIKVLNTAYGSPVARERFLHEARAAGAITHQHIVPVVDFGLVETGEPYIVMEYVDGITLEEQIEREAPLPAEDAVEICAQLLTALEVIHGAGLVHRDIKPANIMLVKVRRPRFHCQLLDFGVSRAMHAAWRRPDLTRVHEVLGTPAYFSPEQAGGGEVEPRWDLWAVGAILYELLSGTLPFRLDSVDQVIADLVNRRLIPLRRHNGELPAWIYQVLDRAHHPDLEQRYPTATLFLQALEQANAHPEGEGDVDLRTTPFVRVDLNTPPPELVEQLVAPQRRRSQQPVLEPPAGIAPRPTPAHRGPFQSQATDGDLPSHRQQRGSWEAAGAFEDEAPTDSAGRPPPDDHESQDEKTIPIQRLSAEELAAYQLGEEDRPLPRSEKSAPVPARVQPALRRTRKTKAGTTWLTVTLAMLILIAASCIIYFGLLLR
jgi:serine/threonine protein kinase